MSDDDLRTYLPAYGDRVALFAFSRAKAASQLSLSTELPNVVERVRARLIEQKGDVVNKRCKKQTNKNALKTTRRIEFGWLCYDLKSCKFQQVRQQQGGGTRHLSVPKEITMTEVMAIGIQLFFPSGTSQKGSAESFVFEIHDFSENVVQDDDTIEEVYNRTKVRMLRLYLCSTRKDSDKTCSDTVETEKRSDILDSSQVIPLTTPDELTSHDDYLPDLTSCDELTSQDYYLPDLTSSENDSQYIAPQRSNVEVSVFKLKILN